MYNVYISIYMCIAIFLNRVVHFILLCMRYNCYTCIYMQSLCIYTYVYWNNLHTWVLTLYMYTCYNLHYNKRTSYIYRFTPTYNAQIMLHMHLQNTLLFFLGGGCYKLHFIRQVDRFKNKKKNILRHQTQKLLLQQS